MVMHIKLYITGLAFVKSVQDGSQNISLEGPSVATELDGNLVTICQRLLDHYANKDESFMK